MRINEIGRISENFFISREKLERLKKYAGDRRYPEALEYAREALSDFRLRMNEHNVDAADDEISETLTPVTYSELSGPLKGEARSRLEELIAYFIDEAGHTPEEISSEEILPMFCEEFCEAVDEEPADRKLVPDGAMISLYNEILGRVMERKFKERPL
jgi:hypothetical protein